MHETEEELRVLQRLLDASHARATEHLRGDGRLRLRLRAPSREPGYRPVEGCRPAKAARTANLATTAKLQNYHGARWG